MDLTTFAQRVRRADFLDGLGIYVEAEQVSIAHVTKRLLRRLKDLGVDVEVKTHAA